MHAVDPSQTARRWAAALDAEDYESAGKLLASGGFF